MMSPPRKLLICWAGFFVALNGEFPRTCGEGLPPLPERRERIVPIWTRKLDLALYSLAWTSDGHTLAAGGRNTIWLYRCPDFFEQAQWRADEGEVSGLAWSPDDRTLASGGRDGVIRLWRDGKVERQLTQGTWILDLAWEPKTAERKAGEPKASVLAVVDDSGLVKLWDQAGTQQASIQLDGNGLALDWSPKGNFLVVSTGQKGSGLVNIETLKAEIRWEGKDILPTYKAPFGYGEDEVNGAAYSPDGHFIASTHQDGRLLIWQADSGSKVAAAQVHGSGVAGARRVAWSPDQNWLCTCGEDGKVNLVPFRKIKDRIQLRDKERIHLLDSHRPVWTVRFSPDGKYLAAAGDTGEIWVWEVPRADHPAPPPRLAPAAHHRRATKPSKSARMAHRRPETKKHWWFW
jgi:WD40 repeat protein